MIPAYDQNLLYKARGSLAWMFEYAVNIYGLDLSVFYDAFLNSSISRNFEHGDSRVVAGMSGIEMAYEVILENNPNAIFVEPIFNVEKSPEYWLGWSLAYYQWYRNISFRKITERIDICKILEMYPKYHEMDIMHFVEDLDELRENSFSETALKRFRMYAQLTQKELADKSGVPLRTIQQYEQRQKNIEHAQLKSVINLSKALYCRPEDLLEN